MSIDIREATAHLPRLIAEVERTGEEIVIHRGNSPVVRLVPFHPLRPPRVLGGWEGRVHIAAGFDEL